MFLNQGELVVFQGQVERVDGRSGTLTLTNMRLLFEGQAAQGLVSAALHGPKTVLMLDAPLWQISHARVDRRLIGRPVLVVQGSKGSHEFKTDQADHWYAAIGQARSQVTHPQYAPPTTGFGGPPVVVNVHAAQAPPPPPPMVFLHCRFCGQLNHPGSGRCGSCGATL
jgi:hypothetical protein